MIKRWLGRVADWMERGFLDGPSRAAALRDLLGTREEVSKRRMKAAIEIHNRRRGWE